MIRWGEEYDFTVRYTLVRLEPTMEDREPIANRLAGHPVERSPVHDLPVAGVVRPDGSIVWRGR